MDAVIRVLVMYFVLLIFFRFAGKRTLGEVTTFDFVLLLIIGESTQQALTHEDNSMIYSVLLIATWLSLDIALSVWKQWSRRVDALIEGQPLLVLADGVPLHDRMKKERIDEEDILSAARELRGIYRLDQIRFVVLERNGTLTVIPKESLAARGD